MFLKNWKKEGETPVDLKTLNTYLICQWGCENFFFSIANNDLQKETAN